MPAAHSSQAIVDAVLSLPKLVVRALSATKDYLEPLGVEAVLLQCGEFLPLVSGAEMRLSANALCQLEVLQNTVDGKTKARRHPNKGLK